MSTFEEKMARLREKDAREKEREEQKRQKKRTVKQRYGLTPRHKENLIKSLEKQIKEATDPELKARLSATLARVLTMNPEERAKRSKDFGALPSSKKTSLLTKVTGTAVDCLSPKKKLVHYMVVECESRRKKHVQNGGLKLAERDTKSLLLEVGASIEAQLNAEDRALLQAEDTTN